MYRPDKNWIAAMLLVYQDYHFTLQGGIEASGGFEAFHDLPHPASASDVLFRDRGSVELRARDFHAALSHQISRAPVRPGSCWWNTEKSSFTCISIYPWEISISHLTTTTGKMDNKSFWQ
jgi:hypothetical protein